MSAGMPKQFHQIWSTSHAISLSSGMELSTCNGFIPTGIGCTISGTLRYSSTHSNAMVTMSALVGGGGRSMAYLYHPLIRIHASRMRVGSDKRKESTADPTLTTFQSRSSWRLALIVRMSALEFL